MAKDRRVRAWDAINDRLDTHTFADVKDLVDRYKLLADMIENADEWCQLIQCLRGRMLANAARVRQSRDGSDSREMARDLQDGETCEGNADVCQSGECVFRPAVHGE